MGIKQVDVIGSRWGGLGECSIFNGGQYAIHRKGWWDFRQLNKAQGVFPETIKERGGPRGRRKETKQSLRGLSSAQVQSRPGFCLLAASVRRATGRARTSPSDLLPTSQVQEEARPTGVLYPTGPQISPQAWGGVYGMVLSVCVKCPKLLPSPSLLPVGHGVRELLSTPRAT